MKDHKPILSVTIDDCEVQHFRAGGKGGQHQNKTSSGSRVIHHPSGARAESREERSQLQNTKHAFLRMVRSVTFRVWMNKQLASGPTPEEKTEKDMQSENLRVEFREEGRWVPEND
jgi:protein subunit release factor B